MSKNNNNSSQYVQYTPYVRRDRYDRDIVDTTTDNKAEARPELNQPKKQITEEKPKKKKNKEHNAEPRVEDGKYQLPRTREGYVDANPITPAVEVDKPKKKVVKKKSVNGSSSGKPKTKKVVKRTTVRRKTINNTPSIQNNEVIEDTSYSVMDSRFAEIEKALGISSGSAANLAKDIDRKNETARLDALNGLEALGKKVNANAVVSTATDTSNSPAVKTNTNNKKDNAVKTNSSNPKVEIDKDTKTMIQYLILGVEAMVFLIVLCVMINFYQKIKNEDFGLAKHGVEESAAENDSSTDDDSMDEILGDSTDLLEEDRSDINENPDTDEILDEDIGYSDSIDVENDNFTLYCTNVTVTLDTEGNPAALIYFTFVNKTKTPLSMSDVFPPSVSQAGEFCETFAALSEYPEEFYNKDTQISDGTSIQCCYAVSLKDAMSPISLTIHDNYETFQDVGTTEISIN